MSKSDTQTEARAATEAARGPSSARPWYTRTWVRLAVCFVFVTTLPLVITAIYTTHRHVAVVREVAAAAALDRAEQAARRLDEGLAAARADLLSVAEWPILESYRSAGSARDREFWREKLGVQLRTFADLKPMYQCLAYSDDSGSDVLRIERRGTATLINQASPLTVGEQDLLAQAMQLLPRQTLLQTLHTDQDLVLLYAARAATRPGQSRSAIWLRLDCSPLLPRSPRTDADASTLALYDEHGQRLFSQASATAPEPIWPASSGGRQFVDSARRLVSIATITPAPGQAQPRWKLALFEPASVLETGVHDFRTAFLGVLGAAFLIAALLGVWLARQFTLPVQRVYEASERIGRGEFNVQLTNTTGDEIGALAEQIGIMAGQLRAAHEDFERRLSDKTEQLVHAERLSTIGRTAAAVAHEINNPSGIISLYAQMLTERLPPNDPNLEKLRVIENKAREISRIVNELLDYSRKPAPVKEWVDSRTLLSAAMSDAEAVHGDERSSGQISREIAVDIGAERLYVDPHQMRRVLRNLIANALHAMPAGGKLTLRCRRTDTDGVTVDVTDTGAGMDSEQLRHLFDPFYTTKRFGAGTGLGLTISQEITERHGGKISVCSEPGKGTTVTINLPDAAGVHDI